MNRVATIHELKALDSNDPWREPGANLEDTVVRALMRASRISGYEFRPEGPEEFQDGPVFMSAQEYGPASGAYRGDVLGGLYFSRYEPLFTGGRFKKASQIEVVVWQRLLNVISDDYGFLFAPPDLLDQPYEGNLQKRYRIKTWWDRYFSAWYSV